jgi:hypothetical protein
MIRKQRVVSIDPGPPEEELLVCVNTAVFKRTVSGSKNDDFSPSSLNPGTQSQHTAGRHSAGLEIQTFRTHIQHKFTDSEPFPFISFFR